MTQKILFTASLFLALFATSAVAQLNIGYMNTGEVLDQLPKTQEIQQELEQLIQEKQTELRTETTAFQDALADFQENRASMTPSEVSQKEKELTQMQADLREFDQSIRAEIAQRRNELLTPVLQAIDAAITEVAEAENLDFVLNEATNAGSSIIFYAAQNQTNITDEVLAKVKVSVQ